MIMKKMRKAVILGLGVSGLAAVSYLLKQHVELIGVDRNPSLASIEGIKFLSEEDPIDLDGVDCLVKSPGIPCTHPWVLKAIGSNIPIVSELDLALSALQTAGKTLIGITGSNGKTTTTLLTAHALQKKGIRAVAAGNVGTPLLSQINDSSDVYVVELSSFQLESIHANPILDFAVILNITPNHLDRHASFEEYAQIKFRIQDCLKPHASLMVHSQMRASFASYFHPHAACIFFDNLKERVETILSLSYRERRSRLYSHDLDNFSAAYAVVSRLGITDSQFGEAVSSFQKPPHRIEFIRTWQGVDFVNDSKATSVDAVIKAVKAMPSRVGLIAGGVDKGGSFREWVPIFRQKVTTVFALGEAQDRIMSELTPHVPVIKVASLEEGVLKASKMAQKGETVLLSPGCSSYDQFKDYQQRGDRYKELVLAL